jgi:parallel beta-helix repeat protein
MKWIFNLKSKKKLIFCYCVFFLSILHCNAFAYTPPAGIPDPNWTTHPIDTPNPAQPSPWTTDQTGYYYVDSSAECSDTGNGNISVPRCTIPHTGLTAGSKIFVRRCQSITEITSLSGTAENPIWVVGVDGGIIQPENTGRFLAIARSSYWIVDGLTFDGTGTPNTSSSGAFKVDGGSHYIAFRNSMVQNMPVGKYSETRQVAAWFGSLTGVAPSSSHLMDVSHVVFYNLNISNNAGGQFLDYESGRHCVLSAGYKKDSVTYGVDSFWILNSTFHNNPEDGIQIGLSASGADQTKCSNIYIGRNTITNNGENGIDLKASSNVIISENLFSGFVKTVYREGAGSGSDGSVGVVNDDGGGPLNDWWIFNTFSNSRCGIRNQSSGGNHYIIGNLFYDLNTASGEVEPSTTGKNGGVAYWQSAGNSSTSVINNTIHDVHGGIYFQNVADVVVKGNIVSDVTDHTQGYHIGINNADTRDLESNIYYDKDGPIRRDNDALDASDLVDTNPLFINENSHDYHLQSGSPASPAINKLKTPSEYALFKSTFARNILLDREQNVRPGDGFITIGAYEVSGVFPSPEIKIILIDK